MLKCVGREVLFSLTCSAPLEDYFSANLIPNHISEVKLKLPAALLLLHDDLPAHAHLASCAVPAAILCPGSVCFLLKALHGTRTPSPFPRASLTPGRKGKLPRSCVWTKTCWGHQGDQGAQTPVLSSANHGDCWGLPAPQHWGPLGQSSLPISFAIDLCS